jgi:hypothetical protein
MNAPKFVYARSGHAPGHLREAFLEALEAYYDSPGGAQARADLLAACGPLWKCTDVLPGGDCDLVRDIVNDDRRGFSYAVAARRIYATLAPSNRE